GVRFFLERTCGCVPCMFISIGPAILAAVLRGRCTSMRATRECYYLRSIDRRWRSELRKARERVLVLSPYVTSPMAELVLECASPGLCEIYTTLSVETFAAGASS